MKLLRIRLIAIEYVNVTIIEYVMVIFVVVVVLFSMKLANLMAQHGRIMI